MELARGEVGRCGKSFSLAAVALRGDGVLVSSVNGWNTDIEPKAHAEGRIIRKIDGNSVVYVARIKKDGTVGLARPCPACQRLLRSKRVQEVFFTVSGNSWGSLNLEDGSEKIRRS